MFNVKDLSLDQLLALYHMAHFNCHGIECEDCPLCNDGNECGSAQAQKIIEQHERETDETILSYNIQKRVSH